ncbi:hypothetical protein VTK56DRAFT_8284 [Thermocarpiscus australiensis]
MDAERHGLYESVFRAFDSLLRATSPRKNQAAAPKSLLAMCLRKVPAYMAALEEWERKEGQASGTKSTLQGAGISFEIYSELESRGAVDGWRHLCLVVRAHGVQIIQDAVSEGLLEDPITALLIRLCLEYMPATECMALIKSFIVRQYPKPHSADDDLFTTPALQPLRILRNCDPSGTSLMPGMLADLLAGGLLPPDWALTKSFTSLWPSAVRLITETKPCQDAVDFIVTTLEELCDLASLKKPRGVPQTRLRGKPQNTLVSAIAALGSVVLLSQERWSQSTDSSATTTAATLRRRIQYIVTTCSARLRRRKKEGRKLGTYLLALCTFLSLEEDSASATVIEASWRGVQNCKGNASLMVQYDATTALMSAIAHYCSRGTCLAPNVYLSLFCDKLETLQLPDGALSNMRVDAAFRLAEHTGDLRDLAFAESLQAKATVCSTPERKRCKKASFSGMRWDEGISEWVTATPATDVLPAAQIPRRRGATARYSADSEEDTADSGEESETDEANPGSPTADDGSDTASETHEDDTLSSNNTGAPSSPFSESSEPEADEQKQAPPSPKHSHPRRGSNDNKPTPPGGFLAARPRRLSRPITRAGDELAFDDCDNGSEHTQAWLCRKKPARFRRSVADGARKRVARASLVYLQPLERPVACKSQTSQEGAGDESSDDELSVL